MLAAIERCTARQVSSTDAKIAAINRQNSAICFETATRSNIMIAMTDHRSIQCPMPASHA